MKIQSIKQAGSNNLLKWAISNDADIYNSDALRAMISDETFYLVTMEDVNFFEAFRMVQTYREKLRIITREPIAVPELDELKKYFPGKVTSGNNSMDLAEMVHMTAESFVNIALQMNADSDIISPEITQLYASMLTMKYTIQLPLGFQDFVSAFKREEIASVLNKEYPSNLDNIFDTEAGNSLMTLLKLLFVRNTSIIKYNPQFGKLVEITKYAPLSKVPYNGKFYRYILSGFYKYDNISHSEVRCNMFKANKTEMAKTMAYMKGIHTPLKTSFVVQLPIYYMMLIANSFSSQELSISYEASMAAIIKDELKISDFVTTRLVDPESEDATEHINAITEYKTRIDEANTAMLNLIPILISPDNECDITNTFALLPSIYTTKAVFTIDPTYEEKYTHHFDPNIAAFFTELMNINKSILK